MSDYNILDSNPAQGSVPMATPVATATGLAAGSQPTVTATMENGSYRFEFGIPAGQPGASGANAANPNFSISVSPLSAGSAPTASVTGSYPNLTIALGVPAGATGTMNASQIQALNDAGSAITTIQAAVAALQAKSLKGAMGSTVRNLLIGLGGSVDVTIPLNSAMPDANYLPLAAITSSTGITLLSSFSVAVKSKTTSSITVTLTYPLIGVASSATITVVAIELL